MLQGSAKSQIFAVSSQLWEAARVVGPLITALLGGWAGGQIALSRFKRERAFDRRLDWYERASRAMFGLSWKLEAVSHQFRRGKKEEAEKHMDDAKKMLDDMTMALAEYELYAKERGAKAIRIAVDGINKMGRLHHEWSAKGVDVLAETTKMQARTLTQTAIILAEEARDDLGWKRLPREPEDWKIFKDAKEAFESH